MGNEKIMFFRAKKKLLGPFKAFQLPDVPIGNMEDMYGHIEVTQDIEGLSVVVAAEITAVKRKDNGADVRPDEYRELIRRLYSSQA